MSAEATAKVSVLHSDSQSLEEALRFRAASDLRDKIGRPFEKMEKELEAAGIYHEEQQALRDVKKRIFDAELPGWQRRAIMAAANKLMES